MDDEVKTGDVHVYRDSQECMHDLMSRSCPCGTELQFPEGPDGNAVVIHRNLEA